MVDTGFNRILRTVMKTRFFLTNFMAALAMIASISVHAENTEPTSKEESFLLPTSDKKTMIHGVISIPKSNHGKKIVPIVFVGGTGSSRDGAAYASPIDPLRLDKYWYRIVAEKLSEAGFSVIRYDNRGIGSGLECDKAAGCSADPWVYAAGPYHCYDKIAAVTTSFNSKREDLLSVFKMIARDKRLDAKRTIVIAHSEGAFHIASLISRKAISPAGVVFIGGPVDSPAALYDWQHVERQVEWMKKVISNNDNYASNKDILERYNIEVKGYDKPIASDSDGWALTDLPTIRERLTVMEKEGKSRILSQPGTGIAIGNIEDLITNIPVASASYFQSLMSDETRAIDGLQQYSGSMTFLFGKNDIVIPWKRQIDLIQENTWEHLPPNIVEVDDMDHNLANPDGTINKEGLEIIVDEVRKMSTHQSRTIKSN
jgi:pimeloyl-ACP methyl ester carboxylesterase